MKITEAKFSRKFNVGQYESEEYTLTALVEDGDNGVTVLSTLKADVMSAYSGKTEEDEKPAPKPKKAPKKEKEPEVEKEEGEEEPVEAPEESPEDDDDDEALDVNDEGEEEEEVEEEKPKNKKGFKKKPQAYSRSSEQHKDIFSSLMRSINPDWKKKEETKARAKVVSQKMEGREFLDEAGEVIPAFKAEVKKLLSAKK